jgi:hypothetical protein
VITGGGILEPVVQYQDYVSNNFYVSDFEALYQKEHLLPHISRPLNLDSPFVYLKKTLPGVLIYRVMKGKVKKELKYTDQDFRRMIDFIPIRMAKMMGGVTKETLDGMIMVANYRFLKGIKLLKGTPKTK